jgi:hypothetical protein
MLSISLTIFFCRIWSGLYQTTDSDRKRSRFGWETAATRHIFTVANNTNKTYSKWQVVQKISNVKTTILNNIINADLLPPVVPIHP